MASKTHEKWMANYEALKAYILEQGHLPDKHVEVQSLFVELGEVSEEENQGRYAG